MLQSSNEISASDINDELGRVLGTLFEMGGIDERALAMVPSGEISMSDFYGKSNQRFIPWRDITGTITVGSAASSDKLGTTNGSFYGNGSTLVSSYGSSSITIPTEVGNFHLNVYKSDTNNTNYVIRAGVLDAEYIDAVNSSDTGIMSILTTPEITGVKVVIVGFGTVYIPYNAPTSLVFTSSAFEYSAPYTGTDLFDWLAARVGQTVNVSATSVNIPWSDEKGTINFTSESATRYRSTVDNGDITITSPPLYYYNVDFEINEHNTIATNNLTITHGSNPDPSQNSGNVLDDGTLMVSPQYHGIDKILVFIEFWGNVLFAPANQILGGIATPFYQADADITGYNNLTLFQYLQGGNILDRVVIVDGTYVINEVPPTISGVLIPDFANIPGYSSPRGSYGIQRVGIDGLRRNHDTTDSIIFSGSVNVSNGTGSTFNDLTIEAIYDENDTYVIAVTLHSENRSGSGYSLMSKANSGISEIVLNLGGTYSITLNDTSVSGYPAGTYINTDSPLAQNVYNYMLSRNGLSTSYSITPIIFS